MVSEHIYDLLGGRLCLDFCNTSESTHDYLNSFAALLSWARQAGALTNAQVAQTTQNPAEGARVLVSAIELRAALFRAFTEARVRLSDLNIINRALPSQRLMVKAGGYQLGWNQPDEGAPEAMLWPVALSAAELLASPADRALVRRCANDRQDCSRLFLDESRNGTRRWCSMRDCGNRAKAHRHYTRSRQ